MKTILTTILLISASCLLAKPALAKDLPKRANPWVELINQKDSDIVPGKAIFKVTARTSGAIMYLKKNRSEEDWKEMWTADSAGASYHVTLDKGRYDIKFEKPGDYHATQRTIDLLDQHFYEAKIYVHRIRKMLTKKPAIYLYGEPGTRLNLNFEANGNVNFVYPAKPNTGWEISLGNNGELKVEDQTHDYLFWEGDRPAPQIDQTLGFNVESHQVIDFLETQLTAMGLNAKEKQDFIAYWGPQLIRNKLNFVQFMVGEDYNTQIATIESDKTIETQIRVFMVYQKIEAPLPMIEQNFVAPQRIGLTLIEWGGGELPAIELEN